MGFKSFIDKAGKWADKNSPAILLVVGIGGLLTTSYLVAKATPKAIKVIEEATDNLNDIKSKEEDEPETEETKKIFRKERTDLYVNTAKDLGVLYGPSILLAGSSIYCLIKGYKVEHSRFVAVSTAYQISEAARKEYRDKVVSYFGAKKENDIRDAINKDRVAANPPNPDSAVTNSPEDTLCYDALSGRYFRSNGTKLKQAENRLNRRLINEMYISLNEFYDEVNLDHIKLGDDLGWNVNDGEIELHLTSMLTDEDIPVLVVDYMYAPRYDYRNLY